MKNKPKVSILMTIYNHQNYLEQSIKSILKQDYKNWELIACENGSTDNSKKILKNIKDKRIKKFFLKKNIGRTNCLNYALKRSSGKYIAVLDSDDIASLDRLKKQINFLEKNKECMLLGTWCSFIDHDGNLINKRNYTMNEIPFIRTLLFFNVIGHSTVMYKKSILKSIGGYPKKFKYMQDYAFFLKVYKKFNIRILHENLTNCRFHHQNSETFRVSKSYLIEDEEKKLLYWSKKNFDLSVLELFYYYYYSFKLKVKIVRKFFNFFR